MPAIIVPRKWEKQPQVPVEVDLAKYNDVKIAWIPAHGGFAPNGAVRPYSIPASPKYSNGGLWLNTSSDVIEFRVPVTYGEHYLDYTVWSVYMSLTGSVAAYQSFMSLVHESGAIIYMQRRATNRYSWGGDIYTGPEIINNGTHLLEVVIGGASSSSNGAAMPFAVYIDGVLVGAPSLADYYNRAYVTFRVGAVRGATETPDMKIYGIFHKNSNLRLSNYYQIFEPRREVLYFDTGSVAIPTLSSPGVTNILTTSATPAVTLTF